MAVAGGGAEVVCDAWVGDCECGVLLAVAAVDPAAGGAAGVPAVPAATQLALSYGSTVIIGDGSAAGLTVISGREGRPAAISTSVSTNSLGEPCEGVAAAEEEPCG